MTPKEIEAERKLFEEWITSTPYEKCVTRHNLSDPTVTWRGAYTLYTVRLAWTHGLLRLKVNNLSR